MLSFFSATLALRVPAPMMQLQGVDAPVGVRAPAGEQFAGGVVPTKTDSSILVQGGSLRTSSYRTPAVEMMQVVLPNEGRTLEDLTDVADRHRVRAARGLDHALAVYAHLARGVVGAAPQLNVDYDTWTYDEIVSLSILPRLRSLPWGQTSMVASLAIFTLVFSWLGAQGEPSAIADVEWCGLLSCVGMEDAGFGPLM